MVLKVLLKWPFTISFTMPIRHLFQMSCELNLRVLGFDRAAGTRAQVDRCSWSWFSSCDSRAAPGTRTSCAARTLRHHRWAACCAPVALHESIRYAPGDHVEQWLNQLLCLDTASRAVPCPKKCDLYPSYWVFNLGVLGHHGNTYLTSLPLVSVRHRSPPWTCQLT